VGEGQGAIQMLMHPHRTTRQGGAPAHRFDLQVEMPRTLANAT
jgi:hypothetical protein